MSTGSAFNRSNILTLLLHSTCGDSKCFYRDIGAVVVFDQYRNFGEVNALIRGNIVFGARFCSVRHPT
jgi:hypothetical protein